MGKQAHTNASNLYVLIYDISVRCKWMHYPAGIFNLFKQQWPGAFLLTWINHNMEE